MTSPSKSTPIASATTANSSTEHSSARPSCRYAGKRCFNARAVKRNGSLHNLCHEHRVRANQNQRRMELKRRLARSREDNSRVEVNAMHAALYVGFPVGAPSSGLDMVDIDVHLGWIPSPPSPSPPLSLPLPQPPSPFAPSHHAMPPYHYLPQHAHQSRVMQPDYTLSAVVGSVLLGDDSYAFTDLGSSGALAKDAFWPQNLHASQGFELYARDSPNSVATALELQQSQQDMWAVPNFLISL